jgi:hypothetical protein
MKAVDIAHPSALPVLNEQNTAHDADASLIDEPPSGLCEQ